MRPLFVVEGAHRYPPIGDYALIGDCHTAALVSRGGFIDWYCPARFDAPAVFCRLLDWAKGGFFAVTPDGRFKASRRYHGLTNVLETTFEAAGGSARLTDFMPIRERTPSHQGADVAGRHRLLRLVEGMNGQVELCLRFKPTFDYAAGETRVQAREGGAVAEKDGHFLVLTCPDCHLESDGNGGLTGRIKVDAGERRWVALDYGEGAPPSDAGGAPDHLEGELGKALGYWRRWAERCTYRGPYREEVLRSALALKVLTYEPTGAIVAAPTTSLPEEIGGVRNWDYRFSWVRDSALILYALMTIGYHAEARDFFRWLRRAAMPDGGGRASDLQVVYTIDGGRELPERTLDHLEGYRGSRPVRVGNAAATQRQVDIYGELLRAANLYHVGRPHFADDDRLPTRQTWHLLRDLVEHAIEQWQVPDQGIWEMRGPPRLFLYSRLMCWAAVDAGIRVAEELGLDAPLRRWRSTRHAIKEAVLQKGYDAELGAFTQSLSSKALDASALAIPRIGFLPPKDPRVRSTVDRIRRDLTHDGMVYRYHQAHSDDGLPGGEATFALCSFWMVDALALTGELDDAYDLFERVCGYANDVGLLSEEIDAATGELIGNFPQGFTHLGLIRAAVNLARAQKHGPEEKERTEAERAASAGEAASEEHGRQTPPAEDQAAG